MVESDVRVPEHGYRPTEGDERAIQDWFTHYDALVHAGDIEAMAEQAHFPITAISDDVEGVAGVQTWDRGTFLVRMREIVGDGDVRSESVRTPHFLGPNLVFVVTDARFTIDGQVVEARYGDLLVRSGGGWRFQTMVQGGWG